MRIRWRNLELPTRVICNRNTLTSQYGEFVIEPFERGFGRTIGNSLRRVLLSSIEGAAVTSVKIQGANHEFSTIPGVYEDVADIILNVKRLRIRLDEEGPLKLLITSSKKGPVTAAMIQSEANAEVINTDLVLATITDENVTFHMELEARRGRGYVTAEENLKEPQELGVIPVASIFSPVLHVQCMVENTRVGKMTNYDKLILQIRTDGSIAPEMALVEASKILRKHLNPFVQYFELGQELQEVPQEETHVEVEESVFKTVEKLNQPIEGLDLSVRASNCLASVGIRSIHDLVMKTEADMLKIKNFGKTSLKEIKDKLAEHGLALGLQPEKTV